MATTRQRKPLRRLSLHALDERRSEHLYNRIGTEGRLVWEEYLAWKHDVDETGEIEAGVACARAWCRWLDWAASNRDRIERRVDE
jgi:hypothetical protein